MKVLVNARKLGSNAFDYATARPMWLGVFAGVAGVAIAGVFVARAVRRRALARGAETETSSHGESMKSHIKDMGKDLAKDIAGKSSFAKSAPH